jgi:hypothetical protein
MILKSAKFVATAGRIDFVHLLVGLYQSNLVSLSMNAFSKDVHFDNKIQMVYTV